jgi:hypothetical protein
MGSSINIIVPSNMLVLDLIANLYLMARSNTSGEVLEMQISKSQSTVASLNEPKSIFSNTSLEEAKNTL